MQSFNFYNPVKIIFGRDTINSLPDEIPASARILMTYGGGSIKKNGVYNQVVKALTGRTLFEFGGIEPNPSLETLSSALALARSKRIDFLLAVGGGSVIDGTKWLAAAVPFEGDPWDIAAKQAPIHLAIPIGVVLTLPAAGSEMNGSAVISKHSTREKWSFSSPLVMPRFSILDPTVTRSLPLRQVAYGIVDAFVHVCEQYLTVRSGSELQDRQAEAILNTLIECGPKAMTDRDNEDLLATMMWTTTNACNGLIGVGVPHDWATHTIGHEITALTGMDHAHTVAIVLPALLAHERERKFSKLVQFAERVWRLKGGDENERITEAIRRTRSFFDSLNVPTRLSSCNIGPEIADEIAARFAERGIACGERRTIDSKAVKQILRASV